MLFWFLLFSYDFIMVFIWIYAVFTWFDIVFYTIFSYYNYVYKYNYNYNYNACARACARAWRWDPNFQWPFFWLLTFDHVILAMFGHRWTSFDIFCPGIWIFTFKRWVCFNEKFRKPFFWGRSSYFHFPPTSQKPCIPNSISINGNLALTRALYVSGGLIFGRS